ncbi:MAG: hypothetical protein NC411_08500 [Bacteroides sp.]|nr:hypothetical protein [Bacteroides sp.]
MSQEIVSNGMNCLYSLCADSPRVVYQLYPMDILQQWIDAASRRYSTSIIVITGMDWNNDLTPWPAKGVPKGCPDFEGKAPQFLMRLEHVVKEIESHIGLTAVEERTLAGVSLSGLFTLWQWAQCELFHNILSLSGSFWYDGFIDWFKSRSFKGKNGFAYFLLGDKEAKSTVRAFDSVAVNTETIVRLLKEQGVRVEYDTVPGNHYQYPIPRLDRAMSALTAVVAEK